MSSTTNRLVAQEHVPFRGSTLVGLTVAAVLGIVAVSLKYSRHPFGWEAISMELFKLPLIAALFWQAWSKRDSLDRNTALRFASVAMSLSLLSDVMFILAER